MPLLSNMLKSSTSGSSSAIPSRISAARLPPARTLYARPVPKPPGSSIPTKPPRSTPSSPFQQTQTRSASESSFLPGHGGKNDMGGPGGQELYPASTPLRKKFEHETIYGVLLACTAMAIAKFAQWNYDPNKKYVLVHDNTKGELDDVKFIPVTVPAEPAREVPTVSSVRRWA